MPLPKKANIFHSSVTIELLWAFSPGFYTSFSFILLLSATNMQNLSVPGGDFGSFTHSAFFSHHTGFKRCPLQIEYKKETRVFNTIYTTILSFLGIQAGLHNQIGRLLPLLWTKKWLFISSAVLLLYSKAIAGYHYGRNTVHIQLNSSWEMRIIELTSSHKSNVQQMKQN